MASNARRVRTDASEAAPGAERADDAAVSQGPNDRESAMGSVQSNQGYLFVELDSREEGMALASRDDRLGCGRVPGGEVAELKVDTRR